MEMDDDSGQSSMENSAASTPAPSVRSESNRWEVGRGICSESADPAEHEERQHREEQPTNVTPPKIQTVPRPASETQNLLGRSQEQQPTNPIQLSTEEARCGKRCWNRLKNNAVYLLVAVVVAFGFLLAYFLSRSPPAESSPTAEPCSNEEWIYYRKNCYYHNLNRTDWNSSQNVCAEYGAALAFIHKEGDLDSIAKVCTLDCWIGLHKTEEGFQWVDGTPYNTSLFKVQGQGECAHVKSKTVYAADCSLPRPSICMMKPYQTAKRPTLI